MDRPPRIHVRRQTVMDYVLLLLGFSIMASAYPLFFLPHNIAPGGISGIATILNHLIGTPVGVMSFALNIPLFLLGFRRMGRSFVIRSFIAMTGTSALIDLIPVYAISNDALLSSVAGGFLLGLGLGLVMRAGATTGGSDMAAKLVHERIPVISVGGLLLFIDFVVIMAAGFAFDFEAALYALVALFISTRVMDRVVEGLNTAKAYFIISDYGPEIAGAVMGEMERGVTLLHGAGAYSRREKEVLFCVITRMQIMQLKRIVARVDPKAFVIATDVHEAMGEGFKRV